MIWLYVLYALVVAGGVLVGVEQRLERRRRIRRQMRLIERWGK